MKATFAFWALVSASAVLAQDPGPSPTESVGCEPHGDHWHCEGPATAATTAAAVVSQPAAADPGPSPTESVGCVAHGDHWDCEGPAVTSAVAVSTTQATVVSSEYHHSASESHDDDHSGSGVLPPSPTASTGCVAHGDHWDCEGPVLTSAVAVATSQVAVISTPVTTTAGTTTYAAANTTLTTTTGTRSVTGLNATVTSATPSSFTGAASMLSAGSFGSVVMAVVALLAWMN